MSLSCRRVGVRHAYLTVLVGLLLSLVPASTTAEDLPETQDGNPMVFGIASHAWWLDPAVYGEQLLPALDDLGVTTVRLTIDWKRFEPAPGQFDWSLYDRVLGELARRHIVIIATFNTIPFWASVNDWGCADETIEIYYCQLRSDMYPAYERAVRAVVSRYAWIEHWEFWNEPEMWRYLGEDPGVYLHHLRIFYDIAHQVNPEIVVAASTLVGEAYFRYIYNLSELWYGDGNEPWDAVSIHPYVWDFNYDEWGRHFELNYDRILGLHSLLIERGDGHKPVWITEYGWNNGVENQARNLVATFDWLKRQPWIEFAHLHMLHDWNEAEIDSFGLMEIVPDADGRRLLTPETQFLPKPLFYDAFKNYPRGGLPARPWQPEVVSFSETGHTLSGRFLKAWRERGGLRILGYPITRPYPRQQPDGSWLLVQDFERARLEFHPTLVGTPYEVLGTLAGNDLTAGRRDEAAFLPLGGCTPTPDRDCFPETGHSLAYGFRAFWSKHGGLTTFGYPISEEFSERNPDTGQVYTVQYFERARFEYHPEYAGTEYEVLLGRLIGNELDLVGWTWPPPGSRLPTLQEFE